MLGFVIKIYDSQWWKVAENERKVAFKEKQPRFHGSEVRLRVRDSAIIRKFADENREKVCRRQVRLSLS
jgi:hypothetical protein